MIPARPYTGEPITEPGRYTGVRIERYHEQLCDGPSVSGSGLRTLFLESPAHFWATSSLNPDRIPSADSEATILGRAAHHLILGEDDFTTNFIVRPPKFDSWRSERSREWRDAHINAGRTVLLPAQLDHIRGMARSLAAHPLVKAGILFGQIEQSFFWRDPETQIWLKARPDALPNWSGDFVDLKTTRSVQTQALERSIIDYGYQVQAALVGDIVKAVGGPEMASFTLIFVESKPPYCCRVVTLRDEDIELGRTMYRAALRRLARCLKTGWFFGPGEQDGDAEYISVPPWLRTRIENDLAYMEQQDRD